jgi:pyrroline-5-carboxylate reductase
MEIGIIGYGGVASAIASYTQTKGEKVLMYIRPNSKLGLKYKKDIENEGLTIYTKLEGFEDTKFPITT